MSAVKSLEGTQVRENKKTTHGGGLYKENSRDNEEFKNLSESSPFFPKHDQEKASNEEILRRRGTLRSHTDDSAAAGPDGKWNADTGNEVEENPQRISNKNSNTPKGRVKKKGERNEARSEKPTEIRDIGKRDQES